MPKLDLTTIMAVLTEAETPPVLVKRIEKGLSDAARQEDDDRPETPPAPKYEPLILMTGAEFNEDSPLFILDYDTESMNHDEAVAGLRRVIWEHNDSLTSKKSSKTIGSIGAAFQFLSGPKLKAAGFKIRYRSPVIMVKVDNKVEEKHGET